MAVSVVMNARARAGTGNEVASFLQSIMPEAGVHSGCTSAIAHQCREDADDVVVLETRESLGHDKRYIAWRRGEDDTDRFKEMLDGASRIGFIERADI